jgi:hypothetical protein
MPPKERERFVGDPPNPITVKWVTIAPDWAALPSLGRFQGGPVSDGGTNRSEADMRHITIRGHHGAHDTEATVFWIFTGIIMVIAFGDVLTLLAVALAIVATAWWISRKLEHRVERIDAEMAPVTYLRPAATSQPDLKNTSAPASWRGPSAA